MKELKSHYMHLLALCIVTVWGTTFVSTKILINSGLRPSDIFFLRFLLAYICICAFSLKKKVWADSVKDEFLLLLTGVCGGSLYFLTENIALTYSYCSNVSLLVCSTPMLTTLLLGVCYKEERVNKKQLLFSVLALIGMALVVLNGHFVLKLSPKGDLLALVAAVTWAVYSLLVRVLNGRYSMLFITRKVFFYGLLTIVPCFLIWPLQTDLSLYSQPVVFLNILFLGVVASFLCYWGWNIVMHSLGVVRATNYIYINPIVTLITSYLCLSERVTWLALVGAAMILCGIYFVDRFRKK